MHLATIVRPLAANACLLRTYHIVRASRSSVHISYSVVLLYNCFQGGHRWKILPNLSDTEIEVTAENEKRKKKKKKRKEKEKEN